MDSYGDGLDELPALRNVADKARRAVDLVMDFRVESFQVERHSATGDFAVAIRELADAVQELDDTDA